MNNKSSSSHFEGQSIHEHISTKKFEYDLNNQHSQEPVQGTFIFLDSCKESSFVILLLVACSIFISIPVYLFITCALTLSLWKTFRSAFLGWSKLRYIQHIAEQEHHEILTNRADERDELRTMYQLKGFKGKLLEDVVDTLMADDQRLLEIMLVEEFGIQLRQLSHPLYQGLCALAGSLVGSTIIIGSFYFSQLWIPFTLFAILLIAISWYFENKAKTSFYLPTLWLLASYFFCFLSLYLIMKTFIGV